LSRIIPADPADPADLFLLTYKLFPFPPRISTDGSFVTTTPSV